MRDHLRSTNENLLATVSSGFLFVYVWIGLFLLLWAMYNAGFFGYNLAGTLITALLCLFLVTPIVPGLITRFVIHPMFLNLLGQGIISMGGCLTAVIAMLGTGVALIYYLSRDLQIAWFLFLGAPLLAAILAGVISLISRRGGIGNVFRRRRW